MGLTLASAIQYAGDCRARGMDPEKFLERFTFFFDISISFFAVFVKAVVACIRFHAARLAGPSWRRVRARPSGPSERDNVSYLQVSGHG